MAINIYDWVELTVAVQKIEGKPQFLMQNVFKNKVQHATEKIAWEEVVQGKNLSKFRGKYADPSPVASEVGKYTKSFSLPRIYESKALNVRDLATISNSVQVVPSSANDVIGNTDAIILGELKALKDRVTNTIEYMCAQAISKGEIVVSGDDVTYEYNFGFENNKHFVTPATAWSSNTSKPLNDLIKWKQAIWRRTGTSPTIALMGADALDAFISNDAVLKALNNLNYQVGKLSLNNAVEAGALYVGSFSGLDIYGYSNIYGTNDAFAPDKVVLIALSDDLAIHFGPIVRVDDTGKTQVFAQDMLVETIPGRYKEKVEITIESWPLPIVPNPDLIIVADVV